ncbi:hypothetical protein BDBG_02757 [Blastomyces gilchristii SLH14081]|uniref:Uncharacterized protein n=1 Tax=Blastomyces gilchristii (strain SLH14081) TaxID=559298 RepID=A0A179UFG4_BLAGS|nr:uncharacterized protein BDBG_02757 [Blastomyces gilchristii SLH14081]OAT06570.1 hypothetical protein BDBG_02757 [Blastomyces gilchristii SLH14081]
MTIWSPTAILVALLLLYLVSFILFAIIRIATGVSIQRVGYFSLRRIAYSPKEGVEVSVRLLGLSLHRPSFAQPTWISLRLKELALTIDPQVLNSGSRDATQAPQSEDSDTGSEKDDVLGAGFQSQSGPGHKTRSKAWKRLTVVKEWIKRLHRWIQWLVIMDVVALDTILKVVDAGEIHIGRLTMAVDTRKKMMARGKLFRHKKDPRGDQRPAEWIFNVRNILLAADGCEPVEIVDNIGLNIHGLLHKDLEGLRDVSIAIKAGRLHVPYDDLMKLATSVRASLPVPKNAAGEPTENGISFADIVEELDQPGSREEAIVQTVADSREFLSSLLRGIQEIQVALSFFRLSQVVESVHPKRPLYLNVVTHEIGIDFHRMDPNRPAHRMYFQRDDIAHQALLAAISLSVSLDDNMGETDKILYIPMATTTIKTTFPSKTVSYSENRGVAERNTNVLFANLVVTSPSIDVEPKHLSQILFILQKRKSPPRSKTRNNHIIISHLLPKASIKLSVHEPVLRFVLPLADTGQDHSYNMLVSSISSISLDIESSHSAEEGIHYSLSSIYRVAAHQLYYQTFFGSKYRLLNTETMEVKIHLNASPEVCVVASGSLNTFSIHLVSGEVSRGVHQVIDQFHSHVQSTKLSTSLDANPPSLLRRLPPWLLQFQFEASGFSVEVAGIDNSIGTTTRGMVLQLQGWTADYQSQKSEPHQRSVKRRTPSHSTTTDEHSFRFTSSSSASRKSLQGQADGRRLAFHVRGLEGFVMESADFMEPESFISVPRFEVALSTSSDLQGPIFHINSTVKAIYLDCSLYRYYAVGIAVSVLRDAFLRPRTAKPSAPSNLPGATKKFGPLDAPIRLMSAELITVDIKASLIQIKCTMPADPPMMLQIYGFAAGRHRWSAPFMRSQLIRLHAEAPKIQGTWARIVSVNNIRVGLRETRRKPDGSVIEEKSVDVSTEFIRVAVPHQMIMYRIFDNFINTAKSVQQLNHRFKTRTNEYVLEKHPEGPKRVPRISLRSKALLFELEDDAFEWKLGCIYRLGLLEQKQRLAREEAFYMKAKRLKELQQRQASSRYRTQSSHAIPGTRSTARSRKRGEQVRSKSADGRPRSGSEPRGRRPTRTVRYNPEGVPSISDSFKVSSEEALFKLQEHNARSWRLRIDTSMRFQNTAIKEIRSMFSGADEPPEDMHDDENILNVPNRPGLLSALISDVHLVIDKPSFPINEYPHFLHRIGKGMPLDMKYSLLIPMNIQLDMGEARANLRDYPLDLLHIPGLRHGQSPRLPSWSLRTDVVIAEEFRDYESSRHVMVNIVPPNEGSDGVMHTGFSIDVRRTVSPVKTYSDAIFEINTSLPTSISWGMSYQPVIQDMMKIIEGFSKPEIDPSERVGFWDKIRLSFHSRINVVWKGDGDVHLRLKGSRDPYVVTGYGAGFVMCWRKDVQWEIHTRDDPREFMAVTGGEYVLAIPDYSHQARHSYDATFDSDSTSLRSSKDASLFKKVIMKLSGNVRWLSGLVFERNINASERSFDFKPHYDVVLKNPRYIPPDDLKDYDAFRGFRSNHIHLSLAVVAPVSRVWSVSNREPSTSYNTVHLTPRFFTHFFSWWSLFSGVMSLPVRQGPLWPGVTKTSKKFGRHLATVKYNLFLSPLFVAHIYKHKDAEDYSEEVVSATGIKVRLDSFMLDLHQRRELVNVMVKGRSKQTKASTMRINRAQLDFISADFRAVSVAIAGTNLADVDAADGILSSFQQPTAPADLSRFTIPDQDFNWVDMDDFVELDWMLISESNPRTRILPLAYSPRFSYFRQTDHEERGVDETGYSPFGDEPSHHCVMSQDNDPRRVQMELIKERLDSLDAQIVAHNRMIGEQELRVVRDSHAADGLKSQYELFVRQGESLQRRRKFLDDGLQRLRKQLAGDAESNGRGSERSHRTPASAMGQSPSSEQGSDDAEIDGLYASPNDEFISDFDNRFIIHNIQLKWNNSLRNIILRYIHQVSQRRGFVYYMSRRAVKFILDIVEEQGKSKLRSREAGKQPPSTSASPSDSDEQQPDDDEISVEDRIEQLLNDAKRFVNADDPTPKETRRQSSIAEAGDKIAPDFTPQNSYHLRLIAPQIQLQSEKNKKAVALVTAKGMQLKVVSIMDKHRVSDDVSGLVQRRFTLDMDSAQFFVTTQKSLFKHLHLYSGNRYGNAPGSAWPPWVSLECMFDFDLDPSGFSRIIQKTSASLRYDKYNTLRLKYNEKIASENDEDNPVDLPTYNEDRMDQILVEFSHVRAICDSDQYYSMYIIVLDLLLFSEPLEKVRSEKLEKIMLASDFSDLRGAPQMVSRLQQRIRQLEEIKNVFQIQAKYLDSQGWQDWIALERDLALCEDELFFIMKAITTSQRKSEERTVSHSSGVLRWALSASELVWHLMTSPQEPLVEFQLRNASYARTDNIDGSNRNTIEIQQIYGLNLLPSAIYPQMIVPYLDEHRKTPQNEDDNLLKVDWFMLEAVAGIPVLNHFEVTLLPLKVQLERELGKKLFEYIFPGMGSNAFENGAFSPFMIKHMRPQEDGSDSEEDHTEPATPASSTGSGSADDAQSFILGPGAMENRLKPTLTFSDHRRSVSPSQRTKGLAMTPLHKDNPRRHLAAGDRPRSASRPSTSRIPRKASADNLRPLSRNATDRSLVYVNGAEERGKKFGLARSSTKSSTTNGDKTSDDLSQMMSRASNFMTLAHVKINDVVLCLSYKGKGERNIEDVHNFVFRLPVLEYRNKTWSNLDLALRLKKDVIKALISHTPAILGNKLSHHRPNKQQQIRLRELASSTQVLSVSDSFANTHTAPSSDGGGSFISHSSASERSESPPRRSFTSTASPLGRSNSVTSSAARSLTMPHIISDSRSARSENIDPRDDGSHLFLESVPRPRTSDNRSLRQLNGGGDDDDSLAEGRRKNSLARIGQKLMGSREPRGPSLERK